MNKDRLIELIDSASGPDLPDIAAAAICEVIRYNGQQGLSEMLEALGELNDSDPDELEAGCTDWISRRDAAAAALNS